MKLKGKVAVITGGGKGIGKAIALTFAREGASIVVMSRTKGDLDKVCEEAGAMGVGAIAVCGDVSRKEDVDKLVQRTLSRFDHIDILVNNAGISKRSSVLDSDEAVWKEVLDVNLYGTYLVTKSFLPAMLSRKSGRIINISSLSGKIGQAFNSAYCASKHGMIGFTRTVALEMGWLGAQEITVNAICPGFVDTEMFDNLIEFQARHWGESKEEVLENRMKTRTIQKRLLDPSEVADLALFLASDDAKGITGQAINIDGGLVMH